MGQNENESLLNYKKNASCVVLLDPLALTVANIWIFFFVESFYLKCFFSNFYKISLKHYSYLHLLRRDDMQIQSILSFLSKISVVCVS